MGRCNARLGTRVDPLIEYAIETNDQLCSGVVRSFR